MRPRPVPLLVYPYQELLAWLVVEQPSAAKWIVHTINKWDGGEIVSIDFADRERSPVEDYGMSPEELVGMRWLREAMGGGSELLIRRPW